MRFKQFTFIVGIYLLLHTYSNELFAYNCDSDCDIKNFFGIVDPVSKTACETEKQYLHCGGIEIPTIEEVFKDIGDTINLLTSSVCSSLFQTFVKGVYNSCVNTGNGFTDIENAPRNVQLAAAILTKLGLYNREDFNNVGLIWCSNIEAGGAGGMVPSPDRILMLEGVKDTNPRNENSITALLGHEMKHIKQIRSMGWENFSCQYSLELGLGHSSSRANYLEKEAYDLEDHINDLLKSYHTSKTDDQLINDFLHPPAPPTKEEINAVLNVINTFLLEENSLKDWERIMNWAESVYPGLFPQDYREETKILPYNVRYYSISNTYLGYNPDDNHFYGYNPVIWGANIIRFGAVPEYIDQAKLAGF